MRFMEWNVCVYVRSLITKKQKCTYHHMKQKKKVKWEYLFKMPIGGHLFLIHGHAGERKNDTPKLASAPKIKGVHSR